MGGINDKKGLECSMMHKTVRKEPLLLLLTTDWTDISSVGCVVVAWVLRPKMLRRV